MEKVRGKHLLCRHNRKVIKLCELPSGVPNPKNLGDISLVSCSKCRKRYFNR